ncbi:MAG: fatty acid desaturase [Proteobacteria bacterium]|nr:fatty acid desaturase [Pseudomonadota bacterium]
MAFTFSASTREVLEQVVREPRFRELTTIPLIAPMQIGLIALAYSAFFASTYSYLQGSLNIFVMLTINGVAIYIAFTPLHDATHRTVSRSRAVNDLLGTIACFALLPGITTRIYRYLHLEHHRFSGDRRKDPDEPFVSTHPLLLPFVLAAPDVLWGVWYLRHWSSRPVSERVEFALGSAFYLGLHTVFLSSPYAWQFFICWMIPQRIGVTLVTYFFAHIQHPKDVLWEEAPFQATVYIRCKRLVRYMMLSQTEHCIHHLLPSVPFYRYHKAWQAGKHLFEAQHIPVRTLFGPINELVLPSDEKEQRLSVTVSRISPVAHGIKAFELRALPGAGPLPAFAPGAHIDVEVPGGAMRQYSLCNASTDSDRYLIAVKKENNGRGGSRAMHEHVVEGQRLSISKPRNNFPLNLSARSYLLIGGGIGLTPILSMAHTLHQSGKPFAVHLCARSRAVLPFSDTLAELPFADRVSVHLDDGDEAQMFEPSRVLGPYRRGRELYMCGPAGFMTWVIGAGRAHGWPDTSLFSETFAQREWKHAENRAFEVELARSGTVLHVGEHDYLIDVLNRAGAGVPCSCTQGICGSCITPVVSGDIDHRDAILSDAERRQGDKMCVCVGRAKSGRLVLDI